MTGGIEENRCFSSEFGVQSSIKVSPKYGEGESNYKSGKIYGSNTVSPTELNFFQRIMVRIVIKKHKKAHDDDISKADNLANTSLVSGVTAMGLMVPGLFVPYIIFCYDTCSHNRHDNGNAAIRRHEKKQKQGKHSAREY